MALGHLFVSQTPLTDICTPLFCPPIPSPIQRDNGRADTRPHPQHLSITRGSSGLDMETMPREPGLDETPADNTPSTGAACRPAVGTRQRPQSCDRRRRRTLFFRAPLAVMTSLKHMGEGASEAA
ncbi:unnamed protein product [Lota lota]